VKKAITYRRASTDEVKQAHSLDNQSRELARFAQTHGYEIVQDIVEYASASSGERDGFHAALTLLSNNPDLVLIVNDLTRLSRDIGNWNQWSNFLPRIRFARKGDIAITALEASLLLIIAANEASVLGARISQGIQASKARCIENGGEWTWCSNSNPHQAQNANKNAAEAWREKIINIASLLEAQGFNSLRQKCAWLNENGFKSRQGNNISPMTLRSAINSAL